MYAVIKTGGKQYRVSEGESLRVEKLPADVDQTVTFDQVLLVGEGENITIGTPFVAGATVTATVSNHGRAPKVRIVKFRRRKHYKRQQGHRQYYTEVQITGIAGAGQLAAAPAPAQAATSVAPAAEAAAPAAAAPAAKPRARKAATRATAKPTAKPAAKKTASHKPAAKKPPAKKSEE